MALVLHAADAPPSVPITGTKVLVFPPSEGWLAQVAYVPPESETIFWDLGYLFDDLKRTHNSMEFSKLLKDIKETSNNMAIPRDLQHWCLNQKGNDFQAHRSMNNMLVRAFMLPCQAQLHGLQCVLNKTVVALDEGGVQQDNEPREAQIGVGSIPLCDPQVQHEVCDSRGRFQNWTW